MLGIRYKANREQSFSALLRLLEYKICVMKRIFMAMMLTGISLVTFAQKGAIARVYTYHPRVIVGLGAYSPFYPYYGFGYAPYYFGYPWYGYPTRPSKMEMKIEDIRNDYRDKIKSAKADKSLTKEERKETVKSLKKERDQEIADLKQNYYKH